MANEVRNLAQRPAQTANDAAALIEEPSANPTMAGVGKLAAAVRPVTGSADKVKQDDK